MCLLLDHNTTVKPAYKSQARSQQNLSWLLWGTAIYLKIEKQNFPQSTWLELKENQTSTLLVPNVLHIGSLQFFCMYVLFCLVFMHSYKGRAFGLEAIANSIDLETRRDHFLSTIVYIKRRLISLTGIS